MTDGRRDIRLSSGTVRVLDTGPAGGGRPTLVLLHGLLVDGRLWTDVVGRLSGHARCVVPDLPLGSHRIAMDDGADQSPPGLARLVAELLETLGLDDVTLVGNDTGGALAQMVAAWHPERVGRLVLTPCDAFEDFFPPAFRHLKLVARVPGGVTAFVQPTRLRALHNTPLVYGLLTRRPLPTDLTASWLEPTLTDPSIRRDVTRFVRAVSNRHTLDAAERLPRFDRPALVVWTEDRRVFKPEHGRRLAELLPRGRLEIVRDAATFVSHDRPDALAELLEAFAAEPAAA